MAPRVSAHEEYGYVRIQYQDEIFLSVMICPNHQIGQTHLEEDKYLSAYSLDKVNASDYSNQVVTEQLSEQ